jgi:hypothetical protein
MSTEEKLCGPKSSKHVKAYTRNELINLVVTQGVYPIRIAKNMNMKELCKALNLPYEDPSGYKKIIYDDFEGCLSLKKDQLIIEHQKDLEAKGIDVETAHRMNKDILCDILYKETDPIEIPEDFTQNDCSKYDVIKLRRIAINLKLDIARAKTARDFCDLISRYYAQKKMTFDLSENPDWKEPITEEDYPCLVPLKSAFNKDENFVLQEHQRKVAKHLLTHRGLIAVHSTGSGKTLTAVASIYCVLTKYPNIKVLIITPLSLVDNFKENILKFGLDLEDPEFKAKVEIKSYEEFINQQKRKKSTDCENTFFIVDEAHNFRTYFTLKYGDIEKGTGAFTVLKCASQAFKVLLLTATPLVNDEKDLVNLISMIDKIDPVDMRDKSFNNEMKQILTDDNYFYNKLRCKVSYYEPPQENYPTRIDIPIEETTLYMDDDYYRDYKLIESKQAPAYIVQALRLSEENSFFHNLRKAINSID